MSEEEKTVKDGLEVVTNEKKEVEAEIVWERNPGATMPEIIATQQKQIEMPETVASDNKIVMPEVVSSENVITMPETVSEGEESKEPEPVSYAAIFAKYAQEPVKEEPVKAEPVKEEPIKEEPVKTEPIKEEPVKTEPIKAEPVKEEPVKTEPVKLEAENKTENEPEKSDYDKVTDIDEYEIEEIEEIQEVEQAQEVKSPEPVVSKAPRAEVKPEKQPAKETKSKGMGMGKRILTAFICAIIFGLVSGVLFIALSTVGTKYVSNSNLIAKIGPTPTPTPIPTPTPTPEPTLSPEEMLQQQEDYLVGMVDEAMKSVVSINVTAEVMYYGQVQEVEAAGSGIVVNKTDTELLIATNYHVIEDTTDVSIQFCDGSTAPAVVKGQKVSNDLAICSVQLDVLGNSTLEAIRVAKLGDSNAVRVGDTAIAIGNALGSGQSVTKGVISALNREITTNLNETGIFIQTDAPINHGNSGGALLNIKGEVIGINESKRSGTDVEGMGFAIPISDAIPIIEELSKDIDWEALPEDQQAKLGIVGVEVRAGATDSYGIPIPKGVYLNEIEENSPAAQAGLKKGDIICEFNGMSITSGEDLSKYLAATAAGTEIKIKYRRFEDGQYAAYETSVIVSEKNTDE